MRSNVARGIDRSVILLATVVLASKQYEFPSESLWSSSGNGTAALVIGLIVVAGVFGALSPLETYAQRATLGRRVAMRRQILTAFGQLVSLAAAAGVPISDPALHVWRRKRTLQHPVRGELIRVATYRLGSAPATRSIRPTPGVGVVGLCWRRNQEVGENVERLAARLPDEQSYEAYRQANGPDAVMGFSWADFTRYRHRGAVFASPIRNTRGGFIGCVSFDAERGYDDLDCHRMWHELNMLCTIIGQDGFDNV
ncbi:hypothetical protein [Thermomonospora cellulosilytica]|uniref:Uncharacterized protein n=1 Tax=Thermomonospora cellulosilytica TaxID=1411118 RepID=A0A7W3MVL3_9ACTN|nr:hypothetical protein [Thermomonospora cellulosilytica]MBA9002711.1 hypothetical protein [Thermomonospora cellulosilytica]